MYTNGIYQQQTLQQTPQAHYQAHPYQANPNPHYQANPYQRYGAVHLQHSVTPTKAPAEAPTVKPAREKLSKKEKLKLGSQIGTCIIDGVVLVCQILCG